MREDRIYEEEKNRKFWETVDKYRCPYCLYVIESRSEKERIRCRHCGADFSKAGAEIDYEDDYEDDDHENDDDIQNNFSEDWDEERRDE